ncbi:MAG: 2-oxoacid:acceptor oxidoreductase subunit alpha [Clostridia bacterium]|nr:2-oxoacid:acceptor oxidoreductase subunit alpha [Clostridia bacterium]
MLQGNEACAEGAIAAGVRFFAGYPITPSTEIAEKLAGLLPKVGGKFIQMEDEIAGIAAVLGASLTGVKAITATSGPGFSLMQENIGFAAMAEVPCVIVNVQRFGPSTGMPTSAGQGDVMQARWGTHGDHPVVVLTPASVEETYHLTVKAVEISEQLRVPVILLMDEVIGHLREKVSLPDLDLAVERNRDTERPRLTLSKELYLPYRPDPNGVPPMASFGQGMRFHVTGLAHDETGFPTNDSQVAGALVTRLNRKIADRCDRLAMAEEYMLDDARLVVVTYGGMARAARKAVKLARAEGLPVGMLRLITLWPFPEKYLHRLNQGVKRVLVPEMNLGQIKLEVERISKGRWQVLGLPKVDGELFTPDELLTRIKEEVAACLGK